MTIRLSHFAISDLVICDLRLMEFFNPAIINRQITNCPGASAVNSS